MSREALASEKAIASAHDVSDGGVAVAIAESCFTSEGLSADVFLDSANSAGGKHQSLPSLLFLANGAREPWCRLPRLRLPAPVKLRHNMASAQRESAWSPGVNFASNMQRAVPWIQAECRGVSPSLERNPRQGA